MRRSLLIHIIILLFITSGFCQDDKLQVSKIPLTKYFDPMDYEGGIQNWSFALDTAGVLFVSNNYGLLEYDGSRWTIYDVPSSTKLRSVYISKDNRIYVGGQGQIGYYLKEKSGFRFISLLDKLPEEKRQISEVWKIFELDGIIYFNTSNKLLALSNEEFFEIDLIGQIQRAFKVNSNLIVQFVDQGLYQFSNNQFTALKGSSELKDEVISIIERDEGFICLTSNGTILLYLDEVLSSQSTSIASQLQSATFNTVTELYNGDIAIGTQNEGLYILDSNFNLKHHFTKNKGLQNRTVLSIMEDDFKNLWVGLNNGINYLELSSPLSLINEEVGLEGTGYVAKQFNDNLYLGTTNGLFSKRSASTDELDYELIPGSEGQVYNLSIVHDQLILNHHRGAFLINDRKLHQFHTVGSWNVLETATENLIIGGGYDGVTLFNKSNTEWEKIGKIDGMEESSRILAFENDSTLWMTHGYKGAYLIELDQSLSKTKNISFFGVDEGFPSNILISVYDLGENLIFTGETGIYSFDLTSNRFKSNDFLSGWLGTEHVSNLTSTDDGDIYFIANRELGYLKQTSFGNYIKDQSIFKRINKLLSDDLENISIVDNQNILIGAKEGFIHFDPTKEFEIIKDFRVIVKEVEIKFPEDSIVCISGGFIDGIDMGKNNSIKFKFACPYFDGVEDLRYAHRLVGFDSKWSRWSPDASKEYTNLPAGTFTFEIKALNIYDKESAITKKRFKILPKWYGSNLAYMTYGAMVLISFGFISMAQSKKHKKEKKQLSQSKDEALKNKDEELSQVSRQSEEQIEQLKNEKLKSEIKHKDRELASTTMHLLNKNEFVQGVRKRIESLVSSESNSKDELKRILKTIERNLKEDDSWDQFAFHFDQVHGDFLKKLSEDEIKLTGQETKLAAYLRMNMSSKEIANLMNISIRGVELARYRLRKKFNLTRDQNLVEHLLNL